MASAQPRQRIASAAARCQLFPSAKIRFSTAPSARPPTALAAARDHLALRGVSRYFATSNRGFSSRKRSGSLGTFYIGKNVSQNTDAPEIQLIGAGFETPSSSLSISRKEMPFMLWDCITVSAESGAKIQSALSGH